MKDELRERLEKYVIELARVDDSEEDDDEWLSLFDVINTLKTILQETAPKSAEAWQPKEGKTYGFFDYQEEKIVVGKYDTSRITTTLRSAHFMYGRSLGYFHVIELLDIEDTVKTAEQLIKEGRRWI